MPHVGSTYVCVNVPLVPPSVNHYVKHVWRGTSVRHYVTKEAEAFKFAVSYAVAQEGLELLPEGHYGVALTIYLGKNQHGDIDNFPKLPLDAIKGVLIPSDAMVKQLRVELDRDWDNPRTRIEVWML
jgi:Holliday junction resolvase RusA-like endonuclease